MNGTNYFGPTLRGSPSSHAHNASRHCLAQLNTVGNCTCIGDLALCLRLRLLASATGSQRNHICLRCIVSSSPRHGAIALQQRMTGCVIVQSPCSRATLMPFWLTSLRSPHGWRGLPENLGLCQDGQSAKFGFKNVVLGAANKGHGISCLLTANKCPSATRHCPQLSQQRKASAWPKTHNNHQLRNDR